mmetsp:Transcript_30073/g.75705  ORF Transcript_30073/g.75705 Transcript_30073/m.75705 type:complete len:335 (+) Transcript_30073:62-1066(+)
MSSAVPVQELHSEAEFTALLSAQERVALCVTAEWSEPAKHMDTVFAKLAPRHQTVSFARTQVETPGIAEKFQVSSVPTFLFFKSGKLVLTEVGASAPALLKALDSFVTDSGITASESADSTAELSPEEKKAQLNRRLKGLIEYAPVMLFMKGIPTDPKCKFSRRMIDLLKEANIPFSSFNILADPEVRNGLKEYSDWPTYPQLYINGKLVGGLDVVLELHAEGELTAMIPNTTNALEDKLKRLINQAPCVLFMKGSADAPQCGFSRRMVELLAENKIEFSTFDILSDPEVRQGLKEYSNWPTYPQLYIGGNLVGGLDVCTELAEEGELQEMAKA